ncbi:MAG TPA: hypothetical protein VM286_08780 [Candidatus Thermoplasmatota archaeon]|nr:hypothetical protein [Candidatus Thermoplasmatota archaeon]
MFWRLVIWLPIKMFSFEESPKPLTLLMPTGDVDHALASIAMAEWSKIIDVQQHFNDLILRFRTIVLTAFGAGFSILVSVSGTISIGRHELLVVGIGLMALMLIAYIIDAGYYFRLLMGAVRAADKFDTSDLAQTKGMFGLTSSITKVTHLPWAISIQSIFYLAPVMVGAALLGWVIGPVWT